MSGGLSYSEAGVDTEKERMAHRGLFRWLAKTRDLGRCRLSERLPSGYFADVIDIGSGTGIAISTDGVGTKALVAELAGRYDTIGVDCVAMNANDVVCTGAEPLTMVDHLSVQIPNADVFEAVGKGLYRGASEAEISICGGETEQVPEMIRGLAPGKGLHLSGTCIGIVRLDSIVDGSACEPGDAVVGLKSNGLHSNGFSLVRKVLFDTAGYDVDREIIELGRPLGEELLEPTRIYVREVKDALREGLEVKALAHITGDGLLNLRRVAAPVGFDIDAMPEVPAIFDLIQRLGSIPDEEMYRVFNMGIGFCVVLPEEEVSKFVAIAERHESEGLRIGTVVSDDRQRVRIPAKRLVGENRSFVLES